MLRAWLTGLAILAGVFLLIVVCLAPFGETPMEGMRVLLEGALGSARKISESFVKTSPLLFTGLSVALAFRAGALNIGAEGQFVAGCIGAVVCGHALGGFPAWLAVGLTLLASAICGFLWGGIAGGLKAWRNVPEVISAIMLNFIALFWLSALIRGPIKDPRSGLPESFQIADAAHLPRLFEGLRFHLGLPLGILLAVLLWLFIAKTTWGFKMRAAGANPSAAEHSGHHPRLIWACSMAASGAIAGLGGGIEVCAITFRVYDNFSSGYGYTAIAVALLAKLNPLAVILTAFFFGALEQGGGTLQRELEVPLALVSIIQGLVVLLALILGFHRPGERTDE